MRGGKGRKREEKENLYLPIALREEEERKRGREEERKRGREEEEVDSVKESVTKVQAALITIK